MSSSFRIESDGCIRILDISSEDEDNGYDSDDKRSTSSLLDTETQPGLTSTADEKLLHSPEFCPAEKSQIVAIPEALATTDKTPQDERFTPSLLDHSKSCWVCSISLQFPYSPHAHPLIPSFETEENARKQGKSSQTQKVVAAQVCAVCAPELIYHDKNIKSPMPETSQGEDENTSQVCICALCLTSEIDSNSENFFLCDECPRSLCDICISICHGGGEAGHDRVQKLRNCPDKWACPICDPPDSMYREIIPPTDQPRVLEDAYAELQYVEQARTNALKELDQVDIEQEQDHEDNNDCEMCDLIMNDLEKGDPKRKFTDEERTEEIELWKEETRKHEVRLLDTISLLEDEFQNTFGCDLQDVYRKLEAESTKSTEASIPTPRWDLELNKILKRNREPYSSQSKESPTRDPDWVEDVNKALNARDSSKPLLRDRSEENSDFDDVEDLMLDDFDPKYTNLSDDETRALEAEEKRLQEKGISVTVVRERSDEQEEKDRKNEFRPRVGHRRPRKKVTTKSTTAVGPLSSSSSSKHSRNKANQDIVAGNERQEKGPDEATAIQTSLNLMDDNREAMDDNKVKAKNSEGKQTVLLEGAKAIQAIPKLMDEDVSLPPSDGSLQNMHSFENIDSRNESCETSNTNCPSRANSFVLIHPSCTTSLTKAPSGTVANRHDCATFAKQVGIRHTDSRQSQETQAACSKISRERVVGSPLVLQGSNVSLSCDVSEKLKAHQKEAIEFMWTNVFADRLVEATEPGGCLLAVS